MGSTHAIVVFKDSYKSPVLKTYRKQIKNYRAKILLFLLLQKNRQEFTLNRKLDYCSKTMAFRRTFATVIANVAGLSPNFNIRFYSGVSNIMFTVHMYHSLVG